MFGFFNKKSSVIDVLKDRHIDMFIGTCRGKNYV